ncbi:stage II sporulation protein P [Metabacillus sediminilitoris]|uniref:Stage II sporulation protein P n=1 Tax=Metabacillus sediminilitoris TaxID=2567941 RepID=A0A4S4BZA3_9BACI|nr:stage II sporulation protein P [Metabacillus sediminilitoris]QGQ44462.1 stage II sporulation protein P [Metabacillus sediminilitoris]THF80085.1 stage II sporulation protein P [Metabacillus sediminilitoris]
MRYLSRKTLKLLLVTSITLFVSLLMYIFYLHGKEPNDITRKQVINDNNEEKDIKGITKFLSDNRDSKTENTSEEINSREIVPDKAALQKDAALDQRKIDAFDENKIKEPNISNEKLHSTFGRKVAFIYFSHNRESFLPYFKNGTTPEKTYHSKLNVSLIGQRLGRRLKSNGIWNRVSNVDIITMLYERDLKFDSSYEMSRKIVIEEKRINPDLEMTFDIHRDALPRSLSTININGKSYAKISFVIGSAHQSYKDNLNFTKGINELIEKSYPGLSRGIIIKSQKQGNGVYNQDLLPNSVIIEIGGVDNNLEELYRTADVLGNIISQYYWENIH